MIVTDAEAVPDIVLSTETALDVVTAALRKIVGIAETPDDDQVAFGMEMLNNMLAEWRSSGADMGLTLPLFTSSTMAVRDSFVAGIKANLTVALCDDFQRNVTPPLMRRALAGLLHIKTTLIPDERVQAEYY